MAPPLKDRFDRNVIDEVAARVRAVDPTFDTGAFTDELVVAFPPLELKDRVNAVADALRSHLPEQYPDALAVVVAVAESGPDEWAGWPLCSFVERHGVDFPDESLRAAAQLGEP